MPHSPEWHPVVASQELRSGHTIVAALVQGQELALWRSEQGVAQAFENRCPHRGVRLTLGRVVNGRLACGYHGWEYAAGSGRCEVIPAMPDIPVPGKVSVKTWQTTEDQAMIWVRRTADGAAETGTATAAPVASATPGRFIRTLALYAPLQAVQTHLAKGGWTRQAPATWRGHLAGLPVTAYALEADAALGMLHLWWDAPQDGPVPPALLAAARRLRADAETRTGS